MKRSRVIKLLLLATIAGLSWLGFSQQQNIYDWWVLRDYTPPAAIANLATADTMNDKARRIFYVNKPELIADTTNFRGYCSTGEQTIVLGCYHSGQQGIFVFDVTDERLAGIEEVTAAHEMLHAVYDRLGGDERQKVDGMLNDYYQNHLSSQRVRETIESYKKTEPNDLLNEMHSIFGTEIAQLPAELEEYYKRYFDDRAAIVAFSQRYENEFASRKSRAEQFEVQIKELKQKIEYEEANLNAQLASIQAEQARLDSLRNSGDLKTYNAGVASYNAQVDDYNSGVAQYKLDVERYNNLIVQYNNIAGELRQLYGAIDTRLSTQPGR